jgi:hypothetical protein
LFNSLLLEGGDPHKDTRETMKGFVVSSIALQLSLLVGDFTGLTFGSDNVHYLLKTNALHYSENLEKDDRVYGHCIAGNPESVSAADVQTTKYDEKCRSLVSFFCRFLPKKRVDS